MEGEKLESTLSKLNTALEVVTKLGGIGKWLIGGFVTVVLTIASGLVWINGTTAALAAQQLKLDQSEAATLVRLQDWNKWRGQKDINEAKLTLVMEQQTRLMDKLTEVSLKQK